MYSTVAISPGGHGSVACSRANQPPAADRLAEFGSHLECVNRMVVERPFNTHR
jgi:hypothetical protein